MQGQIGNESKPLWQIFGFLQFRVETPGKHCNFNPISNALWGNSKFIFSKYFEGRRYWNLHIVDPLSLLFYPIPFFVLPLIPRKTVYQWLPGWDLGDESQQSSSSPLWSLPSHLSPVATCLQVALLPPQPCSLETAASSALSSLSLQILVVLQPTCRSPFSHHTSNSRSPCLLVWTGSISSPQPFSVFS